MQRKKEQPTVVLILISNDKLYELIINFKMPLKIRMFLNVDQSFMGRATSLLINLKTLFKIQNIQLTFATTNLQKIFLGFLAKIRNKLLFRPHRIFTIMYLIGYIIIKKYGQRHIKF
ncbi:hypothetical protein BpHYR1_013295 [Brachionus plicatilis]|uniref:Uncharacterized protein n=1 Tax=Brachionus plicatilis TaxID=10195 RepID=A0A3M7RVY4_BRAPC|nr:hypothetical protein BpHYR1_013295 [Brachionus plicatilis]